MNHRLFRDTAILFLLIGALDFLANKLYLYWTTWWMDVILHFLAGWVVSMTVILVLCGLSWLSRRHIIGSVILSVLAVGLLWELFELRFEITSLLDGAVYWLDTSSDIFLDLFGGFLGMKYSFYILNKYGK